MRRLGLAACLVLGACGEVAQEPPKPAVPKVVNFDGILLPGGPEEAKQSGLRVCDGGDGGYYGYTCRKADRVTFLGVPALRASAHLAYPDPMDLPAEKRTPAHLRYEEVTFDFEPVEVNYPCQADTRADPNACAKDQDGPLPTLERKLAAEGWRFWDYRWGREYVKPGAHVKITVGQGRYDGTVSLRRITPEEVAEEVKRIQEKDAQRQKAAADHDQFITDMAK